MSVHDLLQWQVGTETTWGTPVTPTARLMGIDPASRLSPVYQAATYQDIRGSLAPAYLGELEKVEGAGTLSGLVLYEDVDYLLDNFLGQATPSGVGPYTRAYTGPLATAPAPRVLTVVHGDAAGAYRLQGGLLKELTITGGYAAPLRFSAPLIGQQVDPGTTAALSDRAVNIVMGAHGTVFIDAFGGTIGTTAVTLTAWAFELSLTHARPLKGYLGSLVPGAYDQPRIAAHLKLSLEFNATSKAYADLILAAAPVIYRRLVRLSFDNTANYQLRFDFAGQASAAPEPFLDRDGVATLDLDLDALYDTGAFAQYLKVNSLNQVSVLP